MIVYTVHEPPEPAADRIERGAALAFVSDGFSLSAAVLAPIWMLAHRVWAAVGIYVAVVAALAGLVMLAGLGLGWAGTVIVVLHVLAGFEASSLRRWSLEHQGWRFLGTVTGRSAAECERRFLESWMPIQPMSRQDEFIATVNALRAAEPDQPGAAAALHPRRGWRLPWASPARTRS